jgi:hypothetical protein
MERGYSDGIEYRREGGHRKLEKINLDPVMDVL